MTSQQADFVQYVGTAFGLPYQVETGGRICFHSSISATDCSSDSIVAVTGTIADFATVAKPTLFQCYRLLKAEWSLVIYWFGYLFSGFVGPQGATSAELLKIKSVLHLWILQFGAGEINTWTAIKSAVNAPASEWTKYMAWLGPTSGFSVDAGANVLPYPADLQTWLTSSCSDSAVECKDLDVFNLKSTACSSSCIAAARPLCPLISANSACPQ